MSFTVFLGNLPAWVTADDIKAWLTAESLVADHIKVIRNPETQESKGFAFIDAPNQEEMQSIIKRFDRAPLEDRLLRANPAQPPRGKERSGPGAAAGAPGQYGDRPAQTGDRGGMRDRRPAGGSGGGGQRRPASGGGQQAGSQAAASTGSGKPQGKGGAQSAIAEELAKAL